MQENNPLQPNFQPEIPKKPNLPSWASILIVVIAVIVVGLVSYGAYRYFTPTPAELPVIKEKPAKLPVSKEKRIHIAYFKLINNKAHVIYDGKDMGEADPMFRYPWHGIILEKDHIFFTRKINGISHAIWDNKDLGEISSNVPPKLSDGHIGFLRIVGNEPHFIYDGKDMGKLTPLWNFDIAGDHYAFMTPAEDKRTTNLIYDGKVIKDVIRFAINEKHLAYVRKSDHHLIYDGKDLGGEVWGTAGKLILAGDHILFTKEVGGKTYIFYDNNNLGDTDTIPKVEITEDHITFLKKSTDRKWHLFHDGQDWGVIPSTKFVYGWREYKVPGVDELKVSGNHVLYTLVSQDFFSTHQVFYDGKYVGNLYSAPDGSLSDIYILDNHYAFINENLEVIHDGKKIGKITDLSKYSIQLAGNHIAYYLQHTKYPIFEPSLETFLRIFEDASVIYDGKELDKGFYVKIAEE